MADATRRNIYIPEDYIGLVEKAEDLAKKNNTSLSNLVIESLKEYLYKNENQDSKIKLEIKTIVPDSKIPEIKEIQFEGNLIIPTQFLYDEKDMNPLKICDLLSISSFYIGHSYYIYETKKKKFLIYKYYQFGSNNSAIEVDKYYQWCSEFSVYDTLSSLIDELTDLPKNIIDQIVRYQRQIEVLDI